LACKELNENCARELISGVTTIQTIFCKVRHSQDLSDIQLRPSKTAGHTGSGKRKKNGLRGTRRQALVASLDIVSAKAYQLKLCIVQLFGYNKTFSAGQGFEELNRSVPLLSNQQKLLNAHQICE
jgi:hypothetical protein